MSFLLHCSELGGEFKIGAIGSGSEIQAKVSVGISPINPLQNYFYANINKFSAGALAEAFGYNLKLPTVLLESGFPNGVLASFTGNPRGKRINLCMFDKRMIVSMQIFHIKRLFNVM